jgi:hypothetical protein
MKDALMECVNALGVTIEEGKTLVRRLRQGCPRRPSIKLMAR